MAENDSLSHRRLATNSTSSIEKDLPYSIQEEETKSNMGRTDFHESSERLPRDSCEKENEVGYQNARQYAQQALQPWLWQYRAYSAMNSFYSMFPYYLMTCLPPSNIQQHGNRSYPESSRQTYQNQAVLNNFVGGAHPERAAQRAPPAMPAGPVPHQQIHAQRDQTTGTEFLIPPLWKRLAAELLDFVVLFYIKLLTTVIVMKHMGYMDNNLFDVDLNVELPQLLDMAEMDYEKAFALSSEIIALEIINRMCITVVETLCIRKGLGGRIGGATPGKSILGMRVVYCDNPIDLGNGRILISPTRDIGFLSAFVRSIIKNFTIAFFFPACLSVFFFQHNRAAYDVLAKTIVVEPVNNREQQL